MTAQPRHPRPTAAELLGLLKHLYKELVDLRRQVCCVAPPSAGGAECWLLSTFHRLPDRIEWGGWLLEMLLCALMVWYFLFLVDILTRDSRI